MLLLAGSVRFWIQSVPWDKNRAESRAVEERRPLTRCHHLGVRDLDRLRLGFLLSETR